MLEVQVTELAVRKTQFELFEGNKTWGTNKQKIPDTCAYRFVSEMQIL